jgi:spore germination cell wall hydrolase CwlJ-like protein
MAVYYEAANQGEAGQAAVAQVVLNRVRDPSFPKTVCGVVLQGSSLRTGCQFSFTCDGSLSRPPDQIGWKRASVIADHALNGYVQGGVGEATQFHTTAVAPYWRSSVVRLARVGAHVFYRWPGSRGRPAAFVGRYAQLPTPIFHPLAEAVNV